MSSYKIFCEKAKRWRIPKLSTKINHWLSINCLSITPIVDNRLQAISKTHYDSFIRRIETIKRRERLDRKNKNKRTADSAAEIVTVDLESEKDLPDRILEESEIKKEKDEPLNLASSLHQDDVVTCIKLNEIRQNLENFKTLVSSISCLDVYGKYFNELIKVLQSFLEVLNEIKITDQYAIVESTKVDNQSEATAYMNTIPIDKTFEEGNKIMIEGILPLIASKYKKVSKLLCKKVEDRDPASYLTLIVRYCFPTHWITDVTLRGSGGRKSLITLWNNKFPLTDPVSGPVETGLGEMRFKALIGKSIPRFQQFLELIFFLK